MNSAQTAALKTFLATLGFQQRAALLDVIASHVENVTADLDLSPEDMDDKESENFEFIAEVEQVMVSDHIASLNDSIIAA